MGKIKVFNEENKTLLMKVFGKTWEFQLLNKDSSG